MHEQHPALFVEGLLEQRAPLIVWYVHVVQQPHELLLHLFPGQHLDVCLQLLEVGRWILVGRNGPIAVRIGLAVLHLGSAKERIQNAGAAVPGHFPLFISLASIPNRTTTLYHIICMHIRGRVWVWARASANSILVRCNCDAPKSKRKVRRPLKHLLLNFSRESTDASITTATLAPVRCDNRTHTRVVRILIGENVRKSKHKFKKKV